MGGGGVYEVGGQVVEEGCMKFWDPIPFTYWKYQKKLLSMGGVYELIFYKEEEREEDVRMKIGDTMPFTDLNSQKFLWQFCNLRGNTENIN